MRGTRKVVLLTAIVATLAVFASLTPVSAAATGGGAVSGTVSITSPATGIPPLNQPKVATTYSFGAITIAGVFRSSNGGNFVGTIKIPAGVQGASPSENANGGSGSVNYFTFAHQQKVVGSFAGWCQGTFKRTLSIVIVKLACGVRVGPKPEVPAKVNVYANFSPTAGNGVTTGVKKANFTGIYTSQ